MNTSRTTFAIDRDVLRARCGVSIYYTIRSTPRVRALSRGEDDVVDGDAAGTKGEGGSADGRGNENRRNRKNSSSDSTTKSLGGVEDRAFLSIDPSRIAVGERGARRVRARGSFVRDFRDAISVVTTHSVRSLTRSPAPRPPRGGLDRERPREEDLSRRGIVRGVECD